MGYLNGKQVFLSGKTNGLVDIDHHYDPESTNPQSGLAVAEALTGVGGGGDCVVYLAKDEANYELLKGYIDAGKTVIIKDDSSYLYLSAYDDDYVSFYSITGGNYGYIDYFSSGAVDEYWSPGLINEEDVEHEYNPNGTNPISGMGVAKALIGVGGDTFVTIAEFTLDEAVNTFTVDESTFPDFSKVKDFYIIFNIAKPAEVQSGKLYVRCKTQDGFRSLIAVVDSWNHAGYVLKGSLYSKWFKDNFRFNMYQGVFAANGTTSYGVHTTIARTETPACGIEIHCAAIDSLIPAGTKITIKGCVGK